MKNGVEAPVAVLGDESIAVPSYAVGVWYDDFSQTTDDEVRALLEAAHQEERDDLPETNPVGV